MPHTEAAEQRLTRFDRQACGDHAIERARDPIACRIVVCEPRMSPREVGVERQPGPEARVVGPLQADTTARTSRFGRAGIADEEQFGIETEIPERDRRLESAHADGAQADFRAARANQRRHAIDELAAGGVDTNHRAACVVAVKAHARVRVELRSRPRSEHGAELRADHGVDAITRVQRIVGCHRELIRIRAQAKRRSQRPRPFDLGLPIHTRHRLADAILPRRRQPLRAPRCDTAPPETSQSRRSCTPIALSVCRS